MGINVSATSAAYSRFFTCGYLPLGIIL